MIADVPFRQAHVVFALSRVETFVLRQMPARQRPMLLDVAVFGGRVLPDVSRAGFWARHFLVGHDDHSFSRVLKL